MDEPLQKLSQTPELTYIHVGGQVVKRHRLVAAIRTQLDIVIARQGERKAQIIHAAAVDTNCSHCGATLRV